MRAVTNDAVAAIRTIGTTIGAVGKVADPIAGAVAQQGAAIENIVGETRTAADQTTLVSGTVACVTVDANATGKAAEAVEAAAVTLRAEAQRLRGRV